MARNTVMSQATARRTKGPSYEISAANAFSPSEMNRTNSQQLFERSLQLMPGGVNSPARAFGGVGGHPSFIERGQGQYLYDVDGNRLIDYIGSWGPLILGHCPPTVVAAIQDAVLRGTSFGAPTARESELAELIIEAVPSIEQVRLVNSGTEATMSALRVARGFTGRDRIIKFAGCYHGHVDSLLVQAGSGALTHGVPSSPGVPVGCTQDTVILPYNDLAALRQVFADQGNKIAGLILEPVVGNMGLVLPQTGFLEECRTLCTAAGSLLIFDEVMTGFRVAYGGAQSRFGIKPDLTTLGKIVGGGLPVGAYGGRREIMQRVSPAGPVYQAGTLSGNPLATAAGVAMLRAIQQTNPYPRLEQQAAKLEAGLRKVATAAGVPHTIARCGSMLTFFFSPDPVVDLTSAMKCDTARFARFFHYLLDNGVYFPCSQFEALFVSACHTDEDLDWTIRTAAAAFQQGG